MNPENGWGKAPQIYTLHEYKNVTFAEYVEQPLFEVKKILSVKEWLPLMGITLPSTLMPGNIIE